MWSANNCIVFMYGTFSKRSQLFRNWGRSERTAEKLHRLSLSGKNYPKKQKRGKSLFDTEDEYILQKKMTRFTFCAAVVCMRLDKHANCSGACIICSVTSFSESMSHWLKPHVSAVSKWDPLLVSRQRFCVKQRKRCPYTADTQIRHVTQHMCVFWEDGLWVYFSKDVGLERLVLLPGILLKVECW